MDPENDAYIRALLGSAPSGPKPIPATPAEWYAQALGDYTAQVGGIPVPSGVGALGSDPQTLPINSAAAAGAGPQSAPAPATAPQPQASSAGASAGGFTDNAGLFHPSTTAQGFTDGRLIADGPQIPTSVLPVGADPASVGVYERPGGYRYARMRVNGQDTEYDLGVLLNPGQATAQAQEAPPPSSASASTAPILLSPQALLGDVIANTPSDVLWGSDNDSSGSDSAAAAPASAAPAILSPPPALIPNVHELLGAASFMPGPIGSVPALVDGGLYWSEGKYWPAAVDFLAAGLGAVDGDAGGTKAALVGIGDAGRLVQRAVARPTTWDWALGGVRGLGVESNAIVQNSRHDDDGPEAGIYFGPDRAGGIYVGSSNHNARRQKEHARAGKFAPGAPVQFIRVPGGRLARQIAEHQKIQEITGGQKAKNSPLVSNKRDPIGPRRRKLLGLPEPRD